MIKVKNEIWQSSVELPTILVQNDHYDDVNIIDPNMIVEQKNEQTDNASAVKRSYADVLKKDIKF